MFIALPQGHMCFIYGLVTRADPFYNIEESRLNGREISSGLDYIR